MSYANSVGQNFTKLLNHRIHYIFTSKPIIHQLFKDHKYKGYQEKIVVSDVVTRGLVYIAGSKNFDPDLLASLKKAFMEMEADGTLDRIRDKYGFVKPLSLEGAGALDS